MFIKHYPFSLTAGKGLGVSQARGLEACGFVAAHEVGSAHVHTTVNMATGNLVIQDKLYHLEDNGTIFNLSYVYNTEAHHWICQPTAKLQGPLQWGQAQLVMQEIDGHFTTYTYNEPKQCYEAPAGEDGTPYIQFDAHTQTWLWAHPKTHEQLSFNHQGQVTAHKNEAGLMTHFSDEIGQLVITLPSGLKYRLDKVGNQRQLVRINQDKQTILHTYLFDKDQLKVSKTADGLVTEYGYDTLLASIVSSDGTAIQFDYHTNQTIQAVIVGKEQPSRYEFDIKALAAVVIDPLGQSLNIVSNQQGQLSQIFFANREANFQYYANGQIKSVSYPDNTSEAFEYNEAGLLIRHVQRDGTIQLFNYQKNMAEQWLLISSAINEDTMQYLYEADKPLLKFKISPEGRVTEFLYDQHGMLEGIRRYLSAKADLIDLAAMPAWKAQHIKHSSLTTFIHDHQGRVISERTYAAVDAEGNGIKNADMQETSRSWDEWNQLVKLEITGGSTTCTQYDGWQRLIHQSVGLGASAQVTTHLYEAKKETIIYPDRHEAVHILSDKGELVAAVEGGETIKCAYQADGELKQVMTADGAVHYTFNQVKDCIQYDISALGVLKVTQFDPHTRCTRVTHYAKPIQVQEPFEFDASHQADALDRTTYEIADANGHPRYMIDAANFITEYRYDAQGHEIASIQYAIALTDAELQALTAGATFDREPNLEQDRIHLTHYDKDQLKIAEQDAAGYITYYDYDAAGRLTYQYASLKPCAMHWQYQPKTSDLAVATQQTIYNCLGQIIREIDADGYVNAYTYHQNGKKASSTRYANKVAQGQDIPIPHTNDHVIQFEYDALDRLSKTVGPFHQETIFAYDEMGRQISKVISDSRAGIVDNADSVRQHTQVYNQLGQIIAEINPLVAEALKKIDKDATLSANEKAKKRAAFVAAHSDRYEYASGLKVKAIDALGNATWFYYDADHRPTLTIDCHGSVTEKIYNAFGEVEIERHYVTALPSSALSALIGGLVTDAIHCLINPLRMPEKDIETHLNYDVRGHVQFKKLPEQYASTYEYNAFGECKEEKHPSTDSTPITIIHEYDQRGLEKTTLTKHKASGLYAKVTHDYDHHLGKCTKSVNAEGIKEVYDYTVTGKLEAIKKSLKSDNDITLSYKTYDAFNRVLTEKDANGNVTTYVYNDQENTTIIIHADQTKTVITKNIFGEIISIRDPLDHVETFEHSATGKVTRHITEASGIYETKHDYIDRVQKETHADGAKTVFKYDGLHLHQQIIDSDNLKLTTTFEMDSLGRKIASIDAQGVRTEYEYTGVGQLKKSIIDPKGLAITEERSYYSNGLLDRIQKGDAKQADQYQEKHHYDAQGNLIEQVIDPEGLNISHKREYDQASRLIKEYSPTGHYKQHFYNHLDQRQFSVEQIDERYARVLEWSYDAQGNITGTRIYSTAIDQGTISQQTLSTLLSFTKTVDDAIHRFIFDQNHHERYKLRVLFDPKTKIQLAYVEETIRDAAGHAILTIQHEQPITYSDNMNLSLQAIAACTNITSENNHFVRRLFDAAGRERFTLDQHGKIQEKRYDDIGQVIGKITYGLRYLPAIDLLSADEKTLNHFVESLNYQPTRDSGEWFIYDGAGRCTHEVNPMGGVVRHSFNAQGKLEEKRYFHSKTAELSLNYHDLAKKIKNWVVEEGKDAAIKMTYDAAGRLETSTDALGYSESFTYDALGNQLTHTNRESHTWSYHYNRANQCTRKISPETTVTEAKLENDKLVSTKRRIKIEKSIQLDANGNQVYISAADNIDTQKRELEAHFNGLNQLIGTTIKKAEIDDGTQPTNLTQRPIKVADLKTQIIYNTRGQKIAESDEADQYKYYAYDALGRLTHEINRKGAIREYHYDTFDRIVKTIKYVTIPNINWINYRESGIPSYVMQSGCVASQEDRVVIYQHDEKQVNGDCLTRQINDEVPYYSDGQSGMARPMVTERHNVFDQVRCVSQLISPGVTADTYRWHDHLGNIVLEVSENLYVTWYERDAFGELKGRHEFANALLEKPSSIATWDAILANVKRNPNQDRIYAFRYDLAGNLIEERQDNIVVQQNIHNPADNTFHMEDVNTFSVKYYRYSPEQKKISINDNGRIQHMHHNELGQVIGEAMMQRTPVGEKTAITPYSEYGIDAHGKRVMIRRCAVSADLNDLTVSPPANEKDQIDLSQFDRRGLLAFKQNAVGTMQTTTYDGTRRVARKCHPQVVWGANKVQVRVLDHTAFHYDQEGNVLAHDTYRDNVLEKSILQQYTAFNEPRAEGKKQDEFPLYINRDSLGRIWSSNRGGVMNITLFDLANRPTMTLRSPSIDLRQYSLSKVLSLLSLSPDHILKNETIYDLGGRMRATKSPKWFRLPSSIPTHQQQHDRWQVIAEINAMGNKTQHEFNQIGFETHTILPPEEITDEKAIKKIVPFVTRHGGNIWGEQIAICDPKGYTEAFLRDEIGQVMVTILGDGTFNHKQVFDIFGYVSKRIHFNGGVTNYERDLLNQCLAIIHPSKTRQEFGYDLQGNRNKISDYFGYLFHLNFDTQNTVIDRYDPSGGLTHIIPDMNGKPITTVNQNGTINRINRNFFGWPLLQTDAGGNTIDNRYNGLGLITDRIGSVTGTHGVEYLPDPTISSLTRVSQRAINEHNVYQDGLIREVHDSVNNKYYTYEYNLEDILVSEIIKDQSGKLLAHMITSYNAHQYPISYTHHFLKAATGYGSAYVETISYDQAYNIRLTTRILDDNSPNGKRTHACSSFSDFNAAHRITIFDGVVTPKGIALAPGHGHSFSYLGPLRHTENSWSATQGMIQTTLVYTADLEPYYTSASNGVVTSILRTPRYQQPDRILTRYAESFPGGNTISNTFTTPTGQETFGEFYENSRFKRNHELDYNLHCPFPSYQIYRSALDDGTLVTDTYTVHPATFDNYRPHIAQGSRRGQRGSVATSYYTWDNHGYLNAKEATADEREADRNSYAYFDNTKDGMVLAKHRLGWKVFRTTGSYPFDVTIPSTLSHYFFHTLDHQLLGCFSERNNRLNGVSFVEAGELHYPRKIKLLGKIARTSESSACAIPERLADEFISSLPSFVPHIVQEGDTIASIAKQYFGGSEDAVDEILIANDLLLNQPLAINSILILPPFVQNKLKADTTSSYSQFLSILQGSILPYLTTPEPAKPKKPRHRWWKTILKVVVTAIALMVAPALGAYLVTALGVTSGLAVAAVYGAAAGLMDAVAQGVAVGAGLQERFSLLEVAEVAVTGGMMKGFGVDTAIQNATGLLDLSKAMLEVGGIAASVQLSEMILGVRRHFDIQAIMTQMAALIISKKLDQALGTHEFQMDASRQTLSGRVMNAVSTGAKTIATDYLGMRLHHVPVNIESLANQALGSMIGASVEDHFSSHDESHSSKKKQDYAATRNKEKRSPSISSPTHHKTRSSHADVDLMLAEDLASQRLISKPGLDISPAGIARAKAYVATQSGKADYAKARYARALDEMGIKPGKQKRFTFDDVMEAAGAMNALREATVYPFERPREFAKGMYKLGTVATKAMMHQYTVQDYVNFGMSVNEVVSRWRADLNSSDAYTRGYARGEALGLFVPGTGAEIGVAKLGMFARVVGKANKVVQFSSKGRLKAAQLPIKGRIRFVPLEDWHPNTPINKGRNGGYLDRFKNEWVKGPSRTSGEPFEWDVQLSPLGKKQLGWASRDKEHLNVSLDGKITHR